MWARHPNFLEVVKGSWSFPTIGAGVAKLFEKLKRLKHRLKDWNKSVFGEIFANLKLVEVAASEAERRYDQHPSCGALLDMNRCTTQLNRALAIEEDYWRQKAAWK
ncbi:hypothetical protein Salat_1162400 [Sesamum alatum]|uniref:Uncharacterized protein n=1 Tax=Sesamum alatum TaxID=300844 RepID=A0AAE1YEZ5_9LAMI|nr:hypothetical protein Salat_1162400 [Sesamum alatum]